MLKYRLISGTLLIAGFGCLLWFQHWVTAVLFTMVACGLLIFALNELFSLLNALGLQGYKTLSSFTGTMLFIGLSALSFIHHDGLRLLQSIAIIETALLVIYVLYISLEAFSETDFSAGVTKWLTSLSAYLFLIVTFSALIKIFYFSRFQSSCSPATGSLCVLFLILVTKAGDIGGYVVGKLTNQLPGGNHKMTPRLSPNKSWEGLAGGIVFSIVMALALHTLLGEKIRFADHPLLTLPAVVILGVVFALAGLVGDLTISLLKRAAQVKDTGSGIPGMGGVLDVIDSLIYIPPIFYVFLLILTYP